VAQHDYSLANQSGQAFRQDLNNALSAIVSINSGATAPATTFAYMLWVDTAAGQVKQRNAANSAWVVIGTLGTANWGLASLTSPSFTGTVSFAGSAEFSGTGYVDLPSGTTAQRPGSPNNGMVRYNTTLNTFEGYRSGVWGAIGGGATGGGADDVFYENAQVVTQNYTLSTGKNAMSAGPITIESGISVVIPSDASWVIV
jgi:hypothetical protein